MTLRNLLILNVDLFVREQAEWQQM